MRNSNKEKEVLGPCSTDYARGFTDESQKQWFELSRNAINEFKSKIQEFISFAQAYDFLATRRQEIEIKTSTNKHYPTGITPKDFGRFSRETRVNYEPIEEVNSDPSKSGYKDQHPHIIAKINTFLDPKFQSPLVIINKTEHCTKIYFRNSNLLPDKNLLDIDVFNSTINHVQRNHCSGYCEYSGLEDIELEFSNSLCRIIVGLEVRVDNTRDITLIYPGGDRSASVGDYLIAHELYKSLLNWDREKHSLDIFMLTAGKLVHFLTQLQLVNRGHPAMTEWMLQGITELKGIQLGSYKKNDLGWPWMALLTPDPNEFATWFKDNAFSSIKLISDKNYLTSFSVLTETKSDKTDESLEMKQEYRITKGAP